MSCENHQAFRASSNLNGEPTYYTTAYEQIEKVKQLTDLKQLWDIAGDRELGVSVRKAAERRARVVEKSSAKAHGQAQTGTDGNAVPACCSIAQELKNVLSAKTHVPATEGTV